MGTRTYFGTKFLSEELRGGGGGGGVGSMKKGDTEDESCSQCQNIKKKTVKGKEGSISLRLNEASYDFNAITNHSPCWVLGGREGRAVGNTRG